LIGGDRFVDLDTPVTLEPDEYIIAADGYVGTNLFGNVTCPVYPDGTDGCINTNQAFVSTEDSGDGLISFVNAYSVGTSSIFGFPGVTGTDGPDPTLISHWYTAGTFIFDAASDTNAPEPSTTALICFGLLITGLCVYSSRIRRRPSLN
jgi:hypothetical protein